MKNVFVLKSGLLCLRINFDLIKENSNGLSCNVSVFSMKGTLENMQAIALYSA